MNQIGTILNERYRLQEQLGDSPNRQTFLSEDIQTKEPVVVKLLKVSNAVSWDDLKLFEREAKILQQIHHPHIPTYLDFFPLESQGYWFALVQSYIPGQSLQSVIEQRSRLPESEIRRIARQVLPILDYLHHLQPPIIHRDIKPGNLLWGKDQQIYLVDFGAVQDHHAAGGRSFTVVGTYGYNPIEQFGGRAVPASDLYALGVTLIHLLTGHPPVDLPQRDLRLQFQDYTDASPALIEWLEILTEPAVERRFSTAQEALEVLESQRISRRQSPSAARIIKPSQSKITLDRTPGELRITIPTPAGSEQIYLAGAICLGLGILTYWIGWIGYGILLLGSGIGIFTYAESQRMFEESLILKPKVFEIRRSLLNRVLWRRKAETEKLASVYYHARTAAQRGANRLSRMVALQTQTGLHLFGGQLTEAEVNWLVQEILDWLAR